MRRGLIAANWKMNGSKSEVEALMQGLANGLQTRLTGSDTCEIVLCPPSIYLSQVENELSTSFSTTAIQLGGQNIYTADKGAFTGEISAQMLTDFGCGFVLVGHSERRELFAESDELVAAKFASAQKHGLTPILCVGESLEQRQADATETVILQQLQTVIDNNGVAALGQAIVAYEPIWAIGTGLSATPEQAQAVHKLIRDAVSEQDESVAQSLRILYGGSVKADNAADLFVAEDIDGALVGGASLLADDFISICVSMSNNK